MSEGYEALTEKEKQTLRLILRGHDAKSTARHLGLSVHTINERLRDARRKLGVSSSREAARLLLDREGGDPEFLADSRLGDALPRTDGRSGEGLATRRRRLWIVGGVLAMSLIVALVALNALNLNALTPAATPPAPPSAQVDSRTAAQATQSALAWLTLVDEGRWEDSWRASGLQFRRANTSKTWAEISKAVRPPLGAVLARTAISQEPVPAPPHGYLLVKFSTRFANKPVAIETVSLEREGQEWKVVGYWIA